MLFLLRLGLGGIFVYAGAVKLFDTVGFAGSIAAYQTLPYFGNYLVAAILPWLELICGLLLISGFRIRPAAAMLTGLNTVFILFLASAMLRGLDIDCGCFRETAAKTPPWLAFVRDLPLLAASIYIFISAERKGSQG
ncbi:MAG: DoxX family membrane protein [Geobacter sp.]|nr:DoxX family membrane protein [Geobacter sp.]